MFAVRAEGKTINLSSDIAKALSGSIKGYKVELHSLPGYVFQVESDSGEQAVKLCMALCRKEGKALKSDAATFQRLA